MTEMIVGYDGEVTKAAYDKLDRLFLAETIFQVIEDTPKSWSLRVGVFGKWGAGKSSLVNIISEIANNNNYPVVRFNPSLYRDASSMWSGFIHHMMQQLKGYEFDFARSIGLMEKAFGFLKENAEDLSDISDQPGLKTIGTGITVLNRLVSYDSKIMSELKKQLKGKKVIVAIDELDRSDPKLIPDLLLALRQILDERNFVFLLSFDRDTVANSISNANPAYGSGHAFLEKIIDFGFFIPDILPDQRFELLVEYLNQINASFIPRDIIFSLKDHLPNNPRRLKLLGRHLASLKREISRHNQSDLMYKVIMTASILHAFSPDLFNKVRKALEDNSVNRINLESIGSSTPRKDALENFVSNMVNESIDVDASSRENLRSLVSEIINDNILWNRERILYQLNLIIYPHAITWAEFDKLFLKWQNNKNSSMLRQWITEQSEKSHKSSSRVISELIDTVVSFRERLLDEGWQARRLDTQTAKVTMASTALKMLDQLIFSGVTDLTINELLTQKRVESLIHQFMTWNQHEHNPGDKKARKAEMTFLKKVCSTQLSDRIRIFDYIENFHMRGSVRVGTEGLQKLQAISAAFGDSLYEEALELFLKKNEISKVSASDGTPAWETILYDPSSKLFSSKYFSAFEKTASKGKRSEIIHANLYDYLNSLLRIATRGGKSLVREAAVQTVKKQKLIFLLWKNATLHELNFAAQGNIWDIREKLISLGYNENDIKLPQWFKNFPESPSIDLD